MLIKPNATILFQGDSITDAGRDRENDTLGNGYPHFVAAMFREQFPEYNARFINLGISGNRTCDLIERWTEDTISLKPDVLSILIGINDTWRRYDGADDPTSAEQYYNNYRSILERVRNEIGNIPIVMLEPFLLPFIADKENYREDLDPKIYMARKLAKEFGAVYIPLDGIFAAKSMAVDPTHWSADGVHPSDAGHMLIAKLWMKAIGA